MQDARKNLSHEHGPFDLIGDVHGCYDELAELLTQLGYEISETADSCAVRAPHGRKVIFVGDLVDRGPGITRVLKLVIGMVEAGTALCVPGNHDIKLLRNLQGKQMEIKNGLAESLSQMAKERESFRQTVISFFENLADHLVLDEKQLVVAHAGMKEEMQGHTSLTIREFALFGEKTGEIDEFGFPVRYNWAAEYHGRAMVVYGHTPVPEAVWLNGTINIDTGCIFGGKLTALRYPEKQIISVPARRTYWPGKPFLKAPRPLEIKNGNQAAPTPE